MNSHNNIRNRKKSKGFTLVELLISMMIISLVLIPILGFVTNSVRMTAESKSKQQATLTAQQVFEEIKSNIDNMSTPIIIENNKLELLGTILKQEGDKFTNIQSNGGTDIEKKPLEVSMGEKNFDVYFNMSKVSELENENISDDTYDGMYKVYDNKIEIIKLGSSINRDNFFEDDGTIKQNKITHRFGRSKKLNIDINNNNINIYSSSPVDGIVIEKKSSVDALKNKIIIDFSEYDKDKFNLNVKNLSSETSSVVIQKLDGQNIDIDVNTDISSTGPVRIYDKSMDSTNINGKKELWDIDIFIYDKKDNNLLFSSEGKFKQYINIQKKNW